MESMDENENMSSAIVHLVFGGGKRKRKWVKGSDELNRCPRKIEKESGSKPKG